jgi:hypothetical protein
MCFPVEPGSLISLCRMSFVEPAESRLRIWAVVLSRIPEAVAVAELPVRAVVAGAAAVVAVFRSRRRLRNLRSRGSVAQVVEAVFLVVGAVVFPQLPQKGCWQVGVLGLSPRLQAPSPVQQRS